MFPYTMYALNKKRIPFRYPFFVAKIAYFFVKVMVTALSVMASTVKV